MNLTDFYCWELTFDSGRRFRQDDNNRLPKGQRLNLYNPPAEFGRPIVLRLIPQPKFGATLPEVTVAIPEGAKPYFCLRTAMAGARPTDRVFIAGYTKNGILRAEAIHWTTGQRGGVEEPLG